LDFRRLEAATPPAISVDLGRTSDGKRCQSRETVRGTKAEAERRLRVRLTEIENGTAATTYHRYQQIAKKYIIPHLGAIEAEKLCPLHIEKTVTSWRAEISPKTNRPLTDRSVRHNFDTLRALCRWATRVGLMGKNPSEAITPPRWQTEGDAGSGT
jgi:site-specific recombinase XerC